MFNKLYQAGTFVLPEYVTEPDENKRKVFACAAKGDEKHAMLAYFDDDDTAKENALSIGLVSEKTYAGNRSLTRYDLASICYLIVNLDVE
jgi:hypothetical protein